MRLIRLCVVVGSVALAGCSQGKGGGGGAAGGAPGLAGAAIATLSAMVTPTPGGKPAQTQAQALQITREEDLPSIRQADKLVVLPPRGSSVEVKDASAVSMIENSLLVRTVVAGDAKPIARVAFYKGPMYLRTIWVDASGDWGVERTSGTNWAVGRNIRLTVLVRRYLPKP